MGRGDLPGQRDGADRERVRTSLALAPITLPLLSPPATARIVHTLGLNLAAERGKTSPIPQLLADRTGWESFVEDVARVHASLSAADRANAVIYAPAYGQAGSLELFGPPRALPPVIGAQNTTGIGVSAGRTATS